MSIRKDSMKIIEYYLRQAIEQGNLHTRFSPQFEALANALALESAGYCRVCCQYLLQNGYIRLVGVGSDPSIIELHSSAIDFLEQDN